MPNPLLALAQEQNSLLAPRQLKLPRAKSNILIEYGVQIY